MKTTRLAALILMLSMLVACGSPAAAPSDPGNDAEPPSQQEQAPGNTDAEVNFYGYDFIIRDHDHGGTYDIIPVSGENRLDDMMLERYKEIEQNNNCTITLTEGDSNAMIASAAIDEKFADIMYDKINRAYGAIKEGMYLDLLTVEGLDVLSGQFGAKSLLDSMTWNGKLYVMYPDTWAVNFAHAFFFIPSVISEMGIMNPHEYKEKGSWNWDTLKQLAADFTKPADSNDGKATYLMSLTTIVVDSALYSNGVTWAEKDASGNYVIGYNNEKTSQALELLSALYTGGYMAKDLNWEPNAIAFINGETAFYGNYSWMGISKDGGYLATNLKEAFSWINFPQGPQGSGEKGVLTFTNPFFLITAQTETSIIGEFSTLLFRDLGDDKNDWYESFENENFFDSQSYDYYISMLDTLTFDNSIFVNKATADTQFMNVAKGKKTASEVLAAISGDGQATLDGFFKVE